jgi:hypothetical protein
MLYSLRVSLNHPENVVTEEEIDTIAQELAKVGGVAWYPGRSEGPLLRTVSQRYRDRARVVIAALERLRASNEGGAIGDGTPARTAISSANTEVDPGDRLQVGAVVVYRPPGEQRATPCRIEKIEDGRAYLVPCPRSDVGWVSLADLSPDATEVRFPKTAQG